MGTFSRERCESGAYAFMRSILNGGSCLTWKEFLFYYEKSPPGQLRDKENPLLEERMRKTWDPLVKQTYSVWVEGPRGRRKWHLSRSSSRNLAGNEGTHVSFLLSSQPLISRR